MEPEKKGSSIGEYIKKNGIAIFIMVAAIILFVFFLFRMGDISSLFNSIMKILNPIIIGVAFAYLLAPLESKLRRFFDRKLSKKIALRSKVVTISKTISVTIAVLIGIFILAAVVMLIIPSLVDSIASLAETLPGQLTSLLSWWNTYIDDDMPYADLLSDIVNALTTQLRTWFSEGLGDKLESIFSFVTTGVYSVIMFLAYILIGIAVAIYALKDRDKFVGHSKKLLYAFVKPKAANEVLTTCRYAHRQFSSFIYGKLLDSLIVGIITFICMLIMGMPYVVLISVIIAITNIIPFFGPFIGGIPSALLILLVDVEKGIYFIIFIIILQQIDGNFIGPKILGVTTGVSEFWVTFALLLFGGIWGIAGMVLGIPLFATLYYILKRITEKKLKKKNYPVATADYINIDRYMNDTDGFLMLKEEEEKPKKRFSELFKRKKSNKKRK